MNDESRKQIEICAVLNLVPYLDAYFMEEDRTADLNYIVERYGDDPVLSENEAFKVLKSAVSERPDLGNIVLIDQSRNNDDLRDDLTQGCTFYNPETGDYYVAFRGTGKGRWEDNGDGMTALSTDMQEESRLYFDEVAQKYLIDANKEGADVYITGHSKGGNEAQYVYMTSEYEYLISGCYNFDGQGFSEKAVEHFREQYREDYEDKLSGMYSVCGRDDFVHDLGIVIIPEENTYFVQTSGSGPASLHMLEHMIGDDTYSYQGLEWSDENDGRGSQGAVGAFAKKLSENMMQLSEEDLHGTALAVMAVTDRLMNGKYTTLGSAKADGTDYIDLLAHGVPTVLAAVFLSREGYGLMAHLVRSGAEEFGPAGAVGIVAGILLLVTACLPQLLRIGISTVVTARFADALIDSANGLTVASDSLSRFLSAVREDFLAAGDRFREKTVSSRTADSASGLSPCLRVDTGKLLDYASRIGSLNSRLSELDRRLNALYSRVSIKSLYQLLISDCRIGFSERLEKCRLYLENTSEDFVVCENRILRQI